MSSSGITARCCDFYFFQSMSFPSVKKFGLRRRTSVEASAANDSLGIRIPKIKVKDLTLKDENEPERGFWSGRFDFLLACLGTAVGLGNVWRFPYLCYKNGGGAFLIPYVLMIFLIGIPVFLIELTLGQYSALGPLNIFVNIAPISKGLGYAMIIASALVCIYYNMILGWTIFYLFDSFRSDLRWQYCDHDFNTDKCFNDKDYTRCKNESSNVYNFRTCFNSSYALMKNISDLSVSERVSPPQEYFNDYMLRRSSGLHDLGSMQWSLVLCLLLSWIVVIGSLIKGIKTSGKVVYFTATFPYLILFILFIQGVTLEGAAEGLKFYLVPDFNRLYDVQVWEAAAIQVFYSFSIGGGGMMTYASYNRFRNNLLRDVMIIGIGDMLTSIFSGLVVFAMLGFMSRQMDKPVAEVIESGTGLAFIAYPDGIARASVPVLWAILFFFMLFLLGIDSQFAGVETLITFIFDQFPKTRNRKPVVVSLIGIVLFLCGLPLTTEGGIYVFELMDNYAAGWPYLFIGLFECVVVAYVYGIGNFLDDVREMTGWNPGLWVRSHVIVVLVTVAPLLIAFILLLSWINFTPLVLGDYTFPAWGNHIGWVLAIVPISCIFLGILHEMFFCHRKQSWSVRVKLWFSPTEIWRANANKNRNENRVEDTVVTLVSSTPTTFNHSQNENAAYDNPIEVE